VSRNKSFAAGRVFAILRPAATRLDPSMRTFFYQGRFCAECGVSLEGRRVWRSRYFCDHCDQTLGHRFDRRRRLILAIFLLIFFLPGTRQSGIDRPSPRTASTPSPVIEEPEPSPDLTWCGARTRKGTPCRRRVQPGERCHQHLGRPSILETSEKR